MGSNTTLLEQYIAELVLSERLRGGFDIRYFKSLTEPEEMWAYVEQTKLPKLGEGSGRAVFLLSSGKVLKLATNSGNGRYQIMDEWETFQRLRKTDLVAQILDVDLQGSWWLMMESVRAWQTNGQMTSETGVVPPMLLLFGRDLYPTMRQSPNKKGFRTYFKDVSKQRPNLPWDQINRLGLELLYKIFILTVKYNIEDIDRVAHWGKRADGKIVCVDYGLGGQSFD